MPGMLLTSVRYSSYKKGDKVCDVRADAAHLTKLLTEYELKVDTVEPNDTMRKNGWFAYMWNHRDLSDPLQREQAL